MYKKTLLFGILISALLIGVVTVTVQSSHAARHSCRTCQLESQFGSQMEDRLESQLDDQHITFDNGAATYSIPDDIVHRLDDKHSQVGGIFSSPTWGHSETADRLHVTFDEDFNNLSLGSGNEGNHVVLAVIPHSGAVK